MVTRKLLAIGVLAAFPLWLSAQPTVGQLCGTVVGESGTGIKAALVVASGAGFQGWAMSKDDGSFCVQRAGAFISARYAGFNPIVKRTSELGGNQIRIELVRADSSVKTLTSCQSLPAGGRGWIGGGPRVKPPGGRYKGPVQGKHDTHWYVRFGKQTLHIVDGYAWHAGLPFEGLLSESTSIEVRGWEFGDTVGLDLSGQLSDGRRWRWVGAPLADAVSYESAAPDEAEFFDRVLDSVCFGVR
jgi:hypothetical protein